MSFQSLARFGAPKNSYLKNLDCAANVLCFADSLSFQRERDFAQRMPTTTNDHQNAIGAYFNRTIDPTRKMKFSFLAIALASIASVASGNSIFPEKKSCAENRFACSAPGTSTSSLNTPTSSSLDTTLSIRGGEVIEPSTLSEVDDILMKAAAEGKLVVIDFSATWVSDQSVNLNGWTWRGSLVLRDRVQYSPY